MLEREKNKILPEEFSTKTLFDFRGGKRVHCVDGIDSQSSVTPDNSTTSGAENPGRYDDPVMGDSQYYHVRNWECRRHAVTRRSDSSIVGRGAFERGHRSSSIKCQVCFDS